MTRTFMDRYGYYQMGDYKTYSNYELMDQYQKNPQPYRFVYNDEVYSQYDWTQEPSQSLNDLYKNRVKELREKYDYIALFYSGGYDSTQMLYAFLENDVYPDEIVRLDSRYDTVSHRHLEGKWKTWKKLEELEKKYPQIKIRRIDNADMVCNWPKIIENANLDIDPIYVWGPRISVHRLVLDTLHEYIDDWKQILNEGKSLCTLHGVDPVQIRYDARHTPEQIIHNFNDIDIYGQMTPMRQMIHKDKRDVLENFFWGDTDVCAKMMIKQGHLIKKYLLEVTDGTLRKLMIMRDLVHLDKKSHFARLRSSDFKAEVIKKIIYPNIFLNDEKFYTAHELPIWGNNDQWYFNSNFPNSQKHWETIYLSLSREDRKHWRRFFIDEKIEQGHHKILTKNYLI